MSKLRKCKRVAALGLAFAVAFTSTGFGSLGVNPVIAYAAETNAYAPSVTTHGASYADGTVTFFTNAEDAFYGQTDWLWYKEYPSYEAAVENHIKNGKNFIEGVGATKLEPNADNTQKSVAVSVSSETKAVLYYLNAGAGHGRLDYEHILVIGDAASTPSETQPANPDTQETGSILNADGTVNFKNATASTFVSSRDANGWGNDRNVAFTLEADRATITADSFGGNAWAVQWQLKDMTSAADYSALVFDVTAAADGTLKYKPIGDTGMTDIALHAGVNHVELKTDRKTINPFFDLSYAGAGSLLFTNMKFVAAEKDPEPGEVISPDAIDFSALDHSADYVDGGTDVKVTYDGTRIIATGSDWGNDWGADGHWQIQLKEVVDTTEDAEYKVTFTVYSEVERDILVKLGNLRDDNAVYGERTIHVGAGKTKVAVTTNKVVDIDDMMVLFALGTSWGSSQNTLTIDNVVVKKIVPVVVKEGAVNFSKVKTELYVGSDWAGTKATVRANATKAVISAENYGWNGEWGIQYMVYALGLQVGETYTVSADITSSTDKNIFVKLDGSGAIAEKVVLPAGETVNYEKSATITQLGDDKGEGVDKLFFALGQMAGEAAGRAGEITIENLVITDSQGNIVIPADKPKPVVGPEYDFTATDNAEHDYADPGKTKDGYDLIWSDEFDGNYGDAKTDANTGLNLENWAYQLGDGTTDCGNYGWGNNELECYTSDVKNIGVNEDLSGDGVADGLLRITASHEDNPYKYANESAKNYTSARIRTTGPDGALFTNTYGYVEARISLPQTQGAWPAFWMLPESTAIYGGWPVSGEIDILETTGLNTNAACGTLHRGNPNQVYKGSGYVTLDEEIRYFHTYAIDWEPGQIRWIYDGKVIYTANDWYSQKGGAEESLGFDAPFDVPFYTILNLAVDSGRFGGDDNAAIFEGDINMYVDYVRVYQKSEGYVASVIPSASKDVADDWANYAGQNQIAEIAADNLVHIGGGMDDASADMSKWYVANGVNGEATSAVVTDAAGKVWHKISVTNQGGENYSTQLIGHFDLKKGYVYKVSFDAYAAGGFVGQSIIADAKEWKGWSAQNSVACKLGAEPESYEFTFESKEAFDKDRIEFNFGTIGTGDAFISNVRVEIVDPATIGATDASGAHKPLANGSLIYNGKFEQGNNRVGFWNACNGTTLVVPRYTTEDITGADVKVLDVASKTNYEAVADGMKYYERRAQISAKAGVSPAIFQSGLKMLADTYALTFEMYSATDSAVKAAVYTVDENGKLGTEVTSAKAGYAKEDGLKKYTLVLKTTEDIANAALVLSFADGTAVQIDNVKMVGAGQAPEFDTHPVGNATEFTPNNADGGTIVAAVRNDNLVTVSGISSGSNWYSPQLGSTNFDVVVEQTYKVSFDYKFLDSNNNGTFDYCIQENGGSWAFAVPTTTVGAGRAGAGEDGYTHYEYTFTADKTVPNAHLNFGFGLSAANNTAIILRDVNVEVVASAVGDEMESDNDETIADDQFTDVDDSDDDNQGDIDDGNGDDNQGDIDDGKDDDNQGDIDDGNDDDNQGDIDDGNDDDDNQEEIDKPGKPEVSPAVPNLINKIIKTVEKVQQKVEVVVKTVVKTVEKIITKLFGKK